MTSSDDGGHGRDVDATWEALKRSYVAKIPSKVDAIAAAWAGDPAQRSREVHRLAHQLTGTSGTYGLDALYEAARRICDLTEARDPDHDEVAAALDALRVEAALLVST